MARPARVLIDRAAARANLARARALAGRSPVLAVVKADAYGHGIARMAEAFAGADGFGVACLEEALALREAGVRKPVLLLEGVFDAAELELVRTARLDVVVHSAEQLAMLERAGAGPALRAWLKVDTGMHRLGVDPAQAPALWRRLAACEAVAGLPVLMTHLASAQADDAEATAGQLECLARVAAALDPPAGERVSIANSAALLRAPAARRGWVRPGLMLYGATPFDDGDGRGHGLAPVMTLATRLIAVRELAAGERVGYGGEWRAARRTRIGIAAIGYGDGYPRHAPSGTPVLVGGHRAALAGRPSMDMLALDLGPEAGAKPGDEVVLWGRGLPVEEVARAAGTIPYELLCAVKLRARYVDVGAAED